MPSGDQINFIKIHFTSNPLTEEEPDRYIRLEVDAALAVQAWRHSLFSFEWLRPDGAIKPVAELTEGEREKRRAVEAMIAQGRPLPMPVLGLGMIDTIEIGAGRAEFLTAAAIGARSVPVHVLKSCEKEVRALLRKLARKI